MSEGLVVRVILYYVSYSYCTLLYFIVQCFTTLLYIVNTIYVNMNNETYYLLKADTGKIWNAFFWLIV